MQIIENIDFGELYRNQVRLSGREQKTAAIWDARAQKMAWSYGLPQDPYIQSFISHIDLQGAQSLLDIGCGPGSICLPLAQHFKQVYALDFSQAMLDIVRQRAQASGIDHVSLLCHSWDEQGDQAWADVPVCDITVVSRASMVADIVDALNKVNQKTRLRAYVSSTVDTCVVDDEALSEHIGRRLVGFPDYIYIVNILHQMGFLPQVSYIHSPIALDDGATPFDAFVDALRWKYGRFSPDELDKLRVFFERNYKNASSSIFLTRIWALVSWQVFAN